MRGRLDHLPDGKRRELAFVIDVITKGFTLAISNRKAPTAKDGRILSIVLFGPYARGDWVDDPIGRYFTDYDLLIIVDNDRLTDALEYWSASEQRLIFALAAGQDLRTPVSFIVHTLDYVNDQLQRETPFFTDIFREGIELLHSGAEYLVQPRKACPETALTRAEAQLHHWMNNFTDSYDDFCVNLERRRFRKAAFEAHQAVENLYNCLLMVMTMYSPRSHSLVRLRQLAERLDTRLTDVWPNKTKFERRSFELLRGAYTKARYSQYYNITAEEIEWVNGRIRRLHAAVQGLCRAHIANLRHDAIRVDTADSIADPC